MKLRVSLKDRFGQIKQSGKHDCDFEIYRSAVSSIVSDYGLDPAKFDLLAGPAAKPSRQRLIEQVERASQTELEFSLVAAIDSEVGQIYQLLAPTAKQKFMSQASHYGRVAFPMCAQNAKKILELMDAGTLSVMSIESSTLASRGAHIEARTKDGTIQAYDHVIDSSGAQLDIQETNNPLLVSMLQRGLIEALDRNGIDVEARSGLVKRRGRPNPSIACVGTLTRGVHFEVNSIDHNSRMARQAVRSLFPDQKPSRPLERGRPEIRFEQDLAIGGPSA